MGDRGVIADGGQSSLGYFFGNAEALTPQPPKEMNNEPPAMDTTAAPSKAGETTKPTPVVIERPVGDDSEKLEKRRQKKERKEAKKAAHIIIPTPQPPKEMKNEPPVKAITAAPSQAVDTPKPTPVDIERPVGDNSEKLEKRRQKKERMEAKKAAHIILPTPSPQPPKETQNELPVKATTAAPSQAVETPKPTPVVIESPIGDNSEKTKPIPVVTERPVEDNPEKLEKRRQKKEIKEAKKANHIIIPNPQPPKETKNEPPVKATTAAPSQAVETPKPTPVVIERPVGDDSEKPNPTPVVIERPVGDNSAKPEKRRRKKETKEAKKEAHIIIQTHETLEDSKVANVNLEKISLEKDLTAQPLGGNPKMDLVSAEIPSASHAKKKIKKMKNKEDANSNSENISFEKDLTVQTLFGNPKTDLGSDESPEGHAELIRKKNMEDTHEDNGQAKINADPNKILVEGNVTGKKKGKRKKTTIKDESQTMCQAVSTEIVGDENGTQKWKMKKNKTMKEETKDLAVQTLFGNPKTDLGSEESAEGHAEKIRKKNMEDTHEDKGQANIDVDPNKILVEGNVTGIKKVKRKKAAIEDESQNMCQAGSTEIVGEEIGTQKRKMKKNKTMKEETKDVTTNVSSSDGKNAECLGPLNTQITSTKDVTTNVSSCDGKNAECLGPLNGAQITSTKDVTTNVSSCDGKNAECLGPLNTQITSTNDVTTNVSSCDGKNVECLGPLNAHITSTKDVTTNVSSCDGKNAECLGPLNAQIISTRRRKLLVLDLNGVLADIVRPPVPEEIRRGTMSIFGQTIVKRPFHDDFLNFCFENFDVGIWSSRSRNRVPKIVDYLLGDLQKKLVFCWDMTHITPTGFQTIENSKKPLVFKELRKIWDNDNPRLGWKKGDYDESNTLLLDDSPYKALLNPVHTAIFPISYCHWNKNDNSLGPGGNLRVYLEGLLASENVQDYVKQNPFGQTAITKQNPSWSFYEQVVNFVSRQSKNQNRFSRGW